MIDPDDVILQQEDGVVRAVHNGCTLFDLPVMCRETLRIALLAYLAGYQKGRCDGASAATTKMKKILAKNIKEC